jgi:hypothetical protein
MGNLAVQTALPVAVAENGWLASTEDVFNTTEKLTLK